MADVEKKYTFYLAQTGEIVYTVNLKPNEATEEKLDKIRLKLAFDHGFEANSIEYEEE